MEVNGVAVMRRRSDSWLNATQILKVAGVDKGKRTKVIEKEILTGPHEKVQGGYGKYQGTWVPYNRGREHCRQYGVENLLRPLLDYDMASDGSGMAGQGIETPTKEQAMAANRKRFYNAGADNRTASHNGNGTFFSNISTTASNAIAAMNRAAQLNSPAPRPPSSQRRTGTASGRSSQPINSQDSQYRGSQQSMQSLASERSFGANGPSDSTYGTQGQMFSTAHTDSGMLDVQEPPRKRIRSSHDDHSIAHVNGVDAFMRDGTPTEPNESFVYQQAGHGVPPGDESLLTALPPLPPPRDKLAEEKKALLLDLFVNTSRHSDVARHPAMLHLSGADLDIPLDPPAYTALHWAASLARVPLLRLLVSKGANMFRGNVVGHTPLMTAIQVNNSFDHNCFPEMLEILSPLIEVRDDQGQNILHHIALTSGIAHRGASSKYYLEALLEFLVRSSSNANSQSGSFENGPSVNPKPISLMRFMSEMVNLRDKNGNTALNHAARIGNRNIIQQLLEVQADPTIANNNNFSPMDFGITLDKEQGQTAIAHTRSPGKPGPLTTRSGDVSSELTNSMFYRDKMSMSFQILLTKCTAWTSSMAQLESQHSAQLRQKQDQIDRGYATIRELSVAEKEARARLANLERVARQRADRRIQLENLHRFNAERRERLLRKGVDPALVQNAQHIKPGFADGVFEIPEDLFVTNPGEAADSSTPPTPRMNPQPHHQAFLDSLPPLEIMKARLEAYRENNSNLKAQVTALKSQSREVEARYRKVVSLCTGVPEDKVDSMLAQLVAAVESEAATGVEATRVKEFLTKLEGVDDA